MSLRRLYCLGPLPPVIHGQSEAFDIFVNSSMLRDAFVPVVIDLNFTNKSLPEKIVCLGVEYLRFRSRLILDRPAALYISFGRGKASFWRDSLFLSTAIKKNIPIVAHYHGGDLQLFLKSLNERYLLRVKSIFENIKRVIVLSNYLVNDFQGLIDDSKIRIVPNCFRVPEHYRLPSSSEISARTNETVRILYLSNVNPDKGFFEVIKSIGILNAQGYNVQLSFVGSFIEDGENTIGNLKKTTHDLIEQYDISKIVKIRGVLHGVQKWEEYAGADIFVLPTYYKSEGMPISIIEAMAAGCAVVTTEYRGIRDLIEHGVEGYFVRERDPEDLARHIAILCSDRTILNAMKIAAQKRALSRFSEEKYISGIMRVIAESV